MPPADEDASRNPSDEPAVGVEALADGEEGEAGEEEVQPLELEVSIDKPSACERHVTVTISRGDIDRYLDDAYSELMPEAAVPGFRAGRAPRKLVEQRFKKEVADKVKGSLLMDSLAQISEGGAFAAISEPDLNLDAVELPEDGPMTFEFDIEVRPEFALPKWKGLKISRPVREFTKEDVELQLEGMLSRYGQLAPHDGPAGDGDYVTVNITTRAGSEQLSRREEEVLRVRSKLSLVDAEVSDFGALMAGATAGAKKQTTVTLGPSAPNEALRGKPVEVEFEVLEVKRLKLPELTEDFLKELGGFDSEGALRDAIQKNLERKLEYLQQQRSRQQITELLTEAATWDLPPALLKRQSVRELERAVMELRRAGFSEAEIRARENSLRQNSSASTAKALKEHFILERIAEEEKLDVTAEDFDKEIFLIAMQSGESPRRVRAQIEKRGLMDVLQNQIIERKVLELVQSEAKFKDEPYEPEAPSVEAIDLAAGGGEESAIPEAVDREEKAESANA